MNDFPKTDTFQDCSGKKITFEYDIFEMPGLYTLNAREVTKKDYGRFFRVYAPNLSDALMNIRVKIRQEINTRYFSDKTEPFDQMNFDYFRGNISSEEGTNEPCLIVDGKKMTFDDFKMLISAHPEFQIEVKFIDG
jgi:hypothetical protein